MALAFISKPSALSVPRIQKEKAFLSGSVRNSETIVQIDDMTGANWTTYDGGNDPLSNPNSMFVR